jgi:hypothetical protein
MYHYVLGNHWELRSLPSISGISRPSQGPTHKEMVVWGGSKDIP